MNIIKSIIEYISNQVLGMRWLNDLIGNLIDMMFGTDFANGRWGLSIQFFIYDFIKIGILLCVMIFIISYIQSYFPPERTKRILGRFKGIGANIIGALLGTVTPFCSCSSIPIFIGFTRAGLSSGVTFSFLISSPLVDLGALVLITSVFGFDIALAYVVAGLVIAVIGGTIIEKTGIGNHIQDFVYNGENIDTESPTLTTKERMIYAKEETLSTYKKVFWYIVIGVGIGSIIHNWIPETWIQAVLGQDNPFSVLIATLVGAPFYADIFGTLPIAEALFLKGVGLGTIMAFMMAVTTLSIPSLIMLNRVVKKKLLVTFIMVVMIGIIVIGYGFNFLQIKLN
ncbi:permease [Acholeplasma granularum]|uniref:permease n=1 Tax=Acholeplasma granularum TaxID=264635 RepID=UPI0004720CA9|nr:permease [Acholeplasma granularum]